jgi:hypothetical protein
MAVFLALSSLLPNIAEFLLVYIDRITLFNISQRRFCDTADYITLMANRKVKSSGRAFYIEFALRI